MISCSTGILRAAAAMGLIFIATPIFGAEPQPAPDSSAEIIDHANLADCAEASPQADPPEQQTVILPTTGLEFSLPALSGSPQSPPSECPADLPPAPVRPAAPDIFGLAAVPIGNRAMHHDWPRASTASLDGIAGPWTELLDQAGQLGHLDPLDLANKWVNWHIRFTDDKGPDRWATPAETMLRGWGDCEDFAIAKMGLLQQLGFPPDDMFLVILREAHRPVDHAILAVRRAGTMYVLDSRTDAALPAGRIADYQPTFSYSGQFRWIYGRRNAARNRPEAALP